MKYLGHHRTLDGAPKGPRPNIFNWTSFDDLLIYRDEQWELMKKGIITLALYRKRVKRWCARYREMRSNQLYWQERATKPENERGQQL